jgi:hypothetical protein
VKNALRGDIMKEEDIDKQEGDNMATTIEKIIRSDNKQHEQFYKHQRARIAELRKLKDDKINGKKVEVTTVIGKLQEAGILDKKGNLAPPYICDED